MILQPRPSSRPEALGQLQIPTLKFLKNDILEFMKKIALFTIGLFVINVTFVSCSKKTEQDKIADAQACLDKATPDTVASCVAKVDGLESKGAYLIRCVGKFVEEGFNDTSKIINAVQNLSGGSGAAQTVGFMTGMQFSTAATAKETVSFCEQSESAGLVMLATLSVMATEVTSLVGCLPNCTTNQVETALAAAATDPTAAATIGSAAVTAYNQNCAAGQTGNETICSQFQAAVTQAGGTSNSAQLGCVLMQTLSGGNPATCAF